MIVLIWLYPATLSPARLIPSLQDSDFSQALWAIDGYQPFSNCFSDKAFPPKGIDYSYIHWMAVPLLVSKPIASLTSLVASYNLVLFFSLIAAAHGANKLAQEEGLSEQAAWLVGVSYAFCPYFAGQILSGHFFYVFGGAIVPYYLWAFSRFLSGRGARMVSASWLLLLWFLLMRSCIYYCLFLIPICCVWAGYRVLAKRSLSPKLAVAILVSGVLASALGLVRSQSPEDTELLLPRANIELYDADLLALVKPSPYHPLWGADSAPPGDGIGFVGSTLILALLWKIGRKKRLVMALAAVSWLVALGPVLMVGGESYFRFPWSVVFEAPGYSGIQVYARALFLTQLFLSISAFSLVKSWRTASVLTCLVLFEFWIGPVPTYDSKPVELFSELRELAPGAVASVPYWPQNTEPLFHQVHHQHSGLRAPILRPSGELRNFYREFPLVQAFSRADGHKNLEQDGASDLQALVDLKFVALDRIRLGEEHSTAWLKALGETFPVEQTWSNERFTILQLGTKPKQEQGVQIDFRRDFQNFCSVGLKRGHLAQSTLALCQKSCRLWLPLKQGNQYTIALEGRADSSVTGMLSWNGEHLGELFWNRGANSWSASLTFEEVKMGANELKIELAPGSGTLGLKSLILRAEGAAD